MAAKLMKQATEERDKVWVVSPDWLTIKNEAWSSGIRALSQLSAVKLGLEGVELQPELTKMVIYGPGGVMPKQQDVDKNNHYVATLVVQLPSEYAGGKLVVYEAGGGELRYEMGTLDGTATFMPHYLVYDADSPCSLDEVTGGYRVDLVYSLTFPTDTPCSIGRRPRDWLLSELAAAVNKLKGGPDGVDVEIDGHRGTEEHDESDGRYIIALLLSKSCTKNQIQLGGYKALPGVDKDRFELLLKVNTLLSAGKQLKFYIAQLQSSKSLDKENVTDSVFWYSIRGEKMGGRIILTKKLNFVNPDEETLDQIWDTGDKSSWQGVERFAVVMWPSSADIANALTVMGEAEVLSIIAAHSYISPITLQRLLSTLHGLGVANRAAELLIVCQKLAGAIVDSANVAQVEPFLTKYVASLGEVERAEFLPSFLPLVAAFSWENIRALVLKTLEAPSYQVRLKRSLDLAAVLSGDSTARTDIVMFAVESARLWYRVWPDAFVSSPKMVCLVKSAVSCNNSAVLADLSRMFASVEAKHLGPVVEALSSCVDASVLPAYRGLISSVARKRRRWLISEYAGACQPFAWQAFGKDFPDSAGITKFLEGPEPSLVIRGFVSLTAAQARVDILRLKIIGSVQITANGQGTAAFVRIRKRNGVFDVHYKDLPKYRKELARLDHILDEALVDSLPGKENKGINGGSASIGNKRQREEDVACVVIE